MTKYNNVTQALLSGQTLNAVAGPADDLIMVEGAGMSRPRVVWIAGTVIPKTYFQGCGGCHFLGLTRPTDVDYTLGSGATSRTAPRPRTRASASSARPATAPVSPIDRRTGHWTAGVRIVRTKQSLDSQVCGQCHVSGTAKEKNYVGKTFSGPNGYTPDRKLTDFYNILGAQYVRNSPTDPKPVIPTTDAEVLPERLQQGDEPRVLQRVDALAHSRSLQWPERPAWTPTLRRCACGATPARASSPLGLRQGRSTTRSTRAARAWRPTRSTSSAACATPSTPSDGEALGLRLEEEELCATCHNSLGPVGEELAPGAMAHHPHREMLDGYGLIGVPTPSERFMDDTTCPDCHMPETQEGGTSHRLLVMTPGTAKAWNVWSGGDSCTPCHTSSSRDSLQAKLDEWEEGVTELTTRRPLRSPRRSRGLRPRAPPRAST